MPRARVLVVDDEQNVLKFCAMALQVHNFDPITAEDGASGLLLYQDMHSEIELALLDVSMPRLGGIELARRMFDIKSHPNIILMTGYAPDVIVPTDLQHLCGLLEKPFTSKQLIRAVEKCLKVEREKHPASN